MGRLPQIDPLAATVYYSNHSSFAPAAKNSNSRTTIMVRAETPLFGIGRRAAGAIKNITSEATPLFSTIPYTCHNSIGIHFYFLAEVTPI